VAGTSHAFHISRLVRHLASELRRRRTDLQPRERAEGLTDVNCVQPRLSGSYLHTRMAGAPPTSLPRTSSSALNTEHHAPLAGEHSIVSRLWDTTYLTASPLGSNSSPSQWPRPPPPPAADLSAPCPNPSVRPPRRAWDPVATTRDTSFAWTTGRHTQVRSPGVPGASGAYPRRLQLLKPQLTPCPRRGRMDSHSRTQANPCRHQHCPALGWRHWGQGAFRLHILGQLGPEMGL
jgi:hypothetical protein